MSSSECVCAETSCLTKTGGLHQTCHSTSTAPHSCKTASVYTYPSVGNTQHTITPQFLDDSVRADTSAKYRQQIAPHTHRIWYIDLAQVSRVHRRWDNIYQFSRAFCHLTILNTAATHSSCVAHLIFYWKNASRYLAPSVLIPFALRMTRTICFLYRTISTDSSVLFILLLSLC